jgi:ribose transport system ATP-binding protein
MMEADKMTSKGLELVRVENITKRFGGVHALDHVSLSISKGEIHALVGENGAGKSTLMKIMAGVHTPDEGQILYKGQAVQLDNPRHARGLGISIVFQELNLFPQLSVVENIFINRERSKFPGLLDEKFMHKVTRGLLESLGLKIDPRSSIRSLPVGERQLIEIARALSQDAELIIMDEPNSALTDRETQTLFAICRQLRKRGVTIIYVSHRLEEVFNIADRITVLRDGLCVGTQFVIETTIPETISKMIGRELKEAFPKRDLVEAERETVLEVIGLSKGRSLESIDFIVRRGEIVGIAGLEGSGKEVLFHTLFGLEKVDSGKLIYEGKLNTIHNPIDAIKLGWGFIPADRREQGIMIQWPIIDNAILVILDRLRSSSGLLNTRKARKTVKQFVDRLNINTDSLYKRVINLSGGNQQKVVLAKWLASNPKFLLLNDPTRGIDVGSKAEIYNLMNQLSTEGISMLFTSSEVDEILGMCDRIIVLYKGRKVFECYHGEISKEDLLNYINGSNLSGNGRNRKQSPDEVISGHGVSE